MAYRSISGDPALGPQSTPMSTKIPDDNVRLKRAYEPPAADDGIRILVDRLWPRAISKQALALDEWMKDIAPSTELRRWFGHDPGRWHEFCRRYAAEVHRKHQGLLEELRARARKGRITLVFSARDEMHNDAVALRNLILHGLMRPRDSQRAKKVIVNRQSYSFVTYPVQAYPFLSDQMAPMTGITFTSLSSAPPRGGRDAHRRGCHDDCRHHGQA